MHTTFCGQKGGNVKAPPPPQMQTDIGLLCFALSLSPCRITSFKEQDDVAEKTAGHISKFYSDMFGSTSCIMMTQL